MSEQSEVRETGELAYRIAEYTRSAIGPHGTVLRVPEGEAAILRAAYISRLGEAALKILDGDFQSKAGA